jgi:hypothetical protein
MNVIFILLLSIILNNFFNKNKTFFVKKSFFCKFLDFEKDAKVIDTEISFKPIKIFETK